MKAIICPNYGPPQVLIQKELPQPKPKSNEVLVRIDATSVTASDVLLRAMNQPCMIRLMLQLVFGFGKPRNPILGMTLSGSIAEVGEDVTLWKVGDPVFAYLSMSAMHRKFGSYAEYICLPEVWNLWKKPSNLTHLQAAALPYGGLLAWHCIKKSKIQKGHEVLVYGASGSIGTMAIQYAKHAGAIVTAVCREKNFSLVKSLGATHVLDYTKDLEKLETYDVILDAVGNSKTSEFKVACTKAVRRGGSYLSIDDDVPSTKREDFIHLAEMAEAGEIVPVIDQCFDLEDMVEAHAYVDGGHKVGNVVISVTDKANKK